MRNERGWSRFEWLLTVSAIGFVALFAVTRYVDLAREGRRMGFELLAHNFTSAVAITRAQWLINRSGADEFFVDINGQLIYMSPEGWPLTTMPIVNEGQAKASAEVCHQLWQTLLQNPEPATLEGQSLRGQRRYHIASVDDHHCRYELVTKERDSHFFDYNPRSGQVLIVTPPHKEISSL